MYPVFSSLRSTRCLKTSVCTLFSSHLTIPQPALIRIPQGLFQQPKIITLSSASLFPYSYSHFQHLGKKKSCQLNYPSSLPPFLHSEKQEGPALSRHWTTRMKLKLVMWAVFCNAWENKSTVSFLSEMFGTFISSSRQVYLQTYPFQSKCVYVLLKLVLFLLEWK